MDTNENQYDTPTAPPPLPKPADLAALRAAQPPRWPTVIGILSICLAGLGILSVPMSQINIRMNPVARQAMALFPDWYMEFTQASTFIGLGVLVIFLIAGIQTLRRKPSGRMLHMLYAGLTIIQIVIVAIMFYRVASQIDTTGQPRHIAIGFRAGMIGGLIGTLAGAIYPTFLLIWFSLRKIREQVRQWSDTRVGAHTGLRCASTSTHPTTRRH